jgi:dehydrogenase/reductase SDR family protein 7B
MWFLLSLLLYLPAILLTAAFSIYILNHTTIRRKYFTSSPSASSASASVNELSHHTKHTLSNKVIWITGASSGIGRALALTASTAYNTQLILSGRSLGTLKQTADQCIQIQHQYYKQRSNDNRQPILIELDLQAAGRDSKVAQNAMTKAMSELQAHGIDTGIDILMNSGGISIRGSVLDTLLEVDRSIMDTNYFGAVALTKAFLRSFSKQQQHQSGSGSATGSENERSHRLRRHRYIGVTSSIQGLIGNGLRSSYAASKFALHGFFESLRYEIEKSNTYANTNDKISITIATPSYVQTNLSLNAYTATGSNYGKMDENTSKGFPPHEVAVRIYEGLVRQQHYVIIADLKAHIGVWLYQFCPPLLTKFMRSRAEKERKQMQES